MQLGNAIKELRQTKKISQKDLAKKIGIAQTSLSQIECGKSEPSKKTVTAICKALKCMPVSLYLLANEESDVPKEKKRIFKMLHPALKGLIHEMEKNMDDDTYRKLKRQGSIDMPTRNTLHKIK